MGWSTYGEKNLNFFQFLSVTGIDTKLCISITPAFVDINVTYKFQSNIDLLGLILYNTVLCASIVYIAYALTLYEHRNIT